VRRMEMPKEVTKTVDLQVNHIKAMLLVKKINAKIQEQRYLIHKLLTMSQELEQELKWSISVTIKGHLFVQFLAMYSKTPI